MFKNLSSLSKKDDKPLDIYIDISVDYDNFDTRNEVRSFENKVKNIDLSALHSLNKLESFKLCFFSNCDISNVMLLFILKLLCYIPQNVKKVEIFLNDILLNENEIVEIKTKNNKYHVSIKQAYIKFMSIFLRRIKDHVEDLNLSLNYSFSTMHIQLREFHNLKKLNLFLSCVSDNIGETVSVIVQNNLDLQDISLNFVEVNSDSSDSNDWFLKLSEHIFNHKNIERIEIEWVERHSLKLDFNSFLNEYKLPLCKDYFERSNILKKDIKIVYDKEEFSYSSSNKRKLEMI
jgi:hypothetical protein